MSDLVKYIESKLGLVIVLILFLVFSLFVFWIFDVPSTPIKAIVGACLFFLVIYLVFDYLRISRKIEDIRQQTSESIENYQLNTINPLEEELFNRLKSELISRKDMLVESEAKYNDATEYFTMWMHQIKTPISGISLIAQNIEDENISNDLKGEVTDINDYVDMVLNYLRLGSDSNDLMFSNVEIDRVIKDQLRKFSNHFFAKNISIDYKAYGKTILTDEKWISFVIGQLLSNALKYSSKGTISIGVKDENKDIVFYIKDQGIGIAPEDLPRVFEKGYTGYNGRINKKSTGIGLYLVKQVCDMISVDIGIKSELNKGTEVTLKFKSEEVDGRD